MATPPKNVLCSHCGRQLGEARVTVHDSDKAMPSGDFCPAPVAADGCYVRALSRAKTASLLKLPNLHGDVETLLRGQR